MAKTAIRRTGLLSGLVLAGLILLLPMHADAVEVRVIGTANGLPSEWITSLAGSEDGIWVGTVNAGVAYFSGGKVTRVYGTRDGVPAPRITSLASFGSSLYAGTEDGLGVFDGFSWSAVHKVGNVLLRNVILRSEPSGSRLWVGAVNTSGGLLRFDGSNWQDMGGGGRGPLNHVQAFAFEGEAAWLGSMNSSVYRKTDAEIRNFTPRDGLPSGNVMSLETFKGTVWAGTSLGPAKFEGGRWVSYRNANGLPLSAVFCLAASPKALYLGGREGLVRYRDGRFEMLQAKIDDLPILVGRVNALLVRGDIVYAGTSSGLLEIRGW